MVPVGKRRNTRSNTFVYRVRRRNRDDRSRRRPRGLPAPLLDLVEIAMVREERVVGLFGGLIGHGLTVMRSEHLAGGLRPNEENQTDRTQGRHSVAIGTMILLASVITATGGLSWTNQIP